jgi:proliferating cell nuclear antigen
MDITIRNLAKADIFSSIFQHIKLFTEHINIMFEKDKVYVQAMDSARVSVFEIHIPSSWFDVYQHNSASAIPIGISSALLFKILNTRDKQQAISMQYLNENTDVLSLNFSCENKSIFNKSFEIPLVDLECDTMTIPEITSQADIAISSVSFANMIQQMKLFGDTLEIKCDEDKIVLYSVSAESGKMLVEIDNEDLTSYSINEGETINLSFSLTQLHNICMYSKLAKDVEIYLTDNYPMKLIYDLGDPGANVTFYLAPKLGDDA